MSKTAAKLLEAAAEIVGGENALAQRLGVGPSLLAKFMTGSMPLPDTLLLRAVDIVLAARRVALRPTPVSPTFKNPEELPPS